MIEKQHVGPGESPDSPEKRVESLVRGIFDGGTAQEERITAILADTISAAIADERRNCAKILDAIKDEFIDWCSINHISSAEQVQIANMLRKAAGAIRTRTR
jgi:hypothetical protein